MICAAACSLLFSRRGLQLASLLILLSWLLVLLSSLLSLPRRGLQLASLLILLSWLLVLLSSLLSLLPLLFPGLFFLGLSCACSSPLSSIYMTETVGSGSKGRVTSIFSIQVAACYKVYRSSSFAQSV